MIASKMKVSKEFLTEIILEAIKELEMEGGMFYFSPNSDQQKTIFELPYTKVQNGSTSELPAV